MDNHGESNKPKLHEVFAATAYNKRLKPPVIKIIEKSKKIPVIGHLVNKLQEITLDIAEQSALSGSEKDALTGLNNRAGVNTGIDQLYKILKRAAEKSGNLEKIGIVVYFVDVNKLKLINDKHGHLAGDELLIGVSQVLKNAFQRPDDVVGRVSGDELVLVGERKMATPDDQDTVVQRILDGMDNFRQEFEKKYPNLPEGSVTLAIGRALFTLKDIDKLMKDNPNRNLADLIIPEADEDMYKAKDSAHATNGNVFMQFTRVGLQTNTLQ